MKAASYSLARVQMFVPIFPAALGFCLWMSLVKISCRKPSSSSLGNHALFLKSDPEWTPRTP